jgi:hypothetical protein
VPENFLHQQPSPPVRPADEPLASSFTPVWAASRDSSVMQNTHLSIVENRLLQPKFLLK